jgi:lipopolysaccharide biosynthesis protein
MSIARKLVSLFYWFFDKEKSLNDFKKRNLWIKNLLTEAQHVKAPTKRYVITAHIFYADFAKEFTEAVISLPNVLRVLVTTTSKDIQSTMSHDLSAAGVNHDVRLTPNRGRNLAPLLVEFREELLKTSDFIHVHSKRSPDAKGFGREWLDRSLKLLLTRNGLSRISSLQFQYPSIGLIYADVSDLQWGINFRWGRSRRVTHKTVNEKNGFDKVVWFGSISFPAGGMFWVKTEAILPLLEMNWTYGLFPIEKNQRDGTLQHGIERLVGELASSRNFDQAVLLEALNRFIVVKPRRKIS